MTGRRARRLLREEMDQRFYRLSQFLGCYLHEGWPEMYGSPQAAVDAAIAEYPIDLVQLTRRELATVLAETPDNKQLRDVLNDGLGVTVYFKEPGEARTFAVEVEAKLMAAIKKHFEHRDDTK